MNTLNHILGVLAVLWLYNTNRRATVPTRLRRREFVAAPVLAMQKNTYDFAVIGAGVFGAWIARSLHQAGQRVVLLDQYGPANNRASSGGESRIIRMGYGTKGIYTRWSLRAMELYKQFYAASDPTLFHQTGFLWLATEKDEYAAANVTVFDTLKVLYEK